jgi:nicotinamide-nucleotide amidase
MTDKQHPCDLVIPDRVRDILISRKQTVAVAESVTAGNLQTAFALAENASEFFQGGITTYNLGQKVRHLSVEPIHAIECNCVSEKVSAQMAQNVAKIFSSDWGIGITGYASPIPEKNIEDLYACYVIYFKDEEMIRHTVTVEKNSPANVMRNYTQKVIDHFLEVLTSKVL